MFKLAYALGVFSENEIDIVIDKNKESGMFVAEHKLVDGTTLNVVVVKEVDPATLNFDMIGRTKTITATLTPSDTTDQLVWTSSDDGVANVNNSGVVTSTGNGSILLTSVIY